MTDVRPHASAPTAMATAAAIGNRRPWVTSEYAHDGLGREERVLDRLLTMVRD